MAANKSTETNLSSYEWMIKPCEFYRDEYKDCTSLKGRFHQYFVHGKTIDCSQWKQDLNSCERWMENNGNVKARDDLIRSEQVRQSIRLSGHLLNDVWEDRSETPSDWNKPLPEWMQKEHEISYLGIKSKELKEGLDKTSQEERTLCVIS